MTDLIYYKQEKELIDIFRDKYPDLEITDATDVVHKERFQIIFNKDLDGPLDDDYIKFLILNGLHNLSLFFELEIRMDPERINKIVDELGV